jgi:hypothetical protein
VMAGRAANTIPSYPTVYADRNGTRDKHTIQLNRIMIKTTLKTKANAQRKHYLFRANELELINKAMEVSSTSNEKLTFSAFLRFAAVQKAENITGRRLVR